MVDIVCKNCGKVFSIEKWRLKRAKFCGRSCVGAYTAKKFPRKGTKASDDTKKKLSESHKGQSPWNKGFKGFVPWNKGATGKQVAWNKGLRSWEGRKERLVVPMITGEKHWNWKGGITEENHKIRSSSAYRAWRMNVFQRDGFSCVICKYRSRKQRDIRADHIKPFSLFPELRLDVDNGRTLCIPCDKKHGWVYTGSRRKKVSSKNEK